MDADVQVVFLLHVIKISKLPCHPPSICPCYHSLKGFSGIKADA